MESGKVKWFNPTKGFGFIQPDDGGQDVFVHITALQQSGVESLDEGQSVTYELDSNRGKVCAINVRVQ